MTLGCSTPTNRLERDEWATLPLGVHVLSAQQIARSPPIASLFHESAALSAHRCSHRSCPLFAQAGGTSLRSTSTRQWAHRTGPAPPAVLAGDHWPKNRSTTACVSVEVDSQETSRRRQGMPAERPVGGAGGRRARSRPRIGYV